MSQDFPPPRASSLSPLYYEALVRRELAVDLGVAGDVTTDALVPADRRAVARIVARRAGRVCGLPCALFAFEALAARGETPRPASPGGGRRVAAPPPRGASPVDGGGNGLPGPLRFAVGHGDGADVRAGAVIATVEGPARVLLSAERTALNLLAHLSGVATATRDLVERAARGGPARVVCTRKTTPGLRALEKYAVRVGGAANHRFGLHDAVLVKDNHRLMAGGVGPAVARARAAAGHLVRVEVEVDTLEQLEEALDAGADAVLLDNFSIADLKQAAVLARGRAVTEASGGVTPETVSRVAATGVDVVSVGWITHSAPALDMGLDFAAP